MIEPDPRKCCDQTGLGGERSRNEADISPPAGVHGTRWTYILTGQVGANRKQCGKCFWCFCVSLISDRNKEWRTDYEI